MKPDLEASIEVLVTEIKDLQARMLEVENALAELMLKLDAATKILDTLKDKCG